MVIGVLIEVFQRLWPYRPWYCGRQIRTIQHGNHTHRSLCRLHFGIVDSRKVGGSYHCIRSSFRFLFGCIHQSGPSVDCPRVRHTGDRKPHRSCVRHTKLGYTDRQPDCWSSCRSDGRAVSRLAAILRFVSGRKFRSTGSSTNGPSWDDSLAGLISHELVKPTRGTSMSVYFRTLEDKR